MEGLQKNTYGTMTEGRAEGSCSAASPSLRILLAGKSGSGKSATGNSILGRPAFESRLGAQSVTRTCQGETGTWNGRSILVVDTPPVFDSSTQNPEIDRAIGDCYRLCAPGPHVLLLVTQLGRFTAQDTAAARRVKEIFGEGAMRYAILLFTHKEDLDDGSLDDYVAQTDNQSLRSVVRECGRRYCGFNNRATGEAQQAQLAELVALVERLERECEGSFYSNDLFFQADVLRRGGGGDLQEDHGHFLDKVRRQVQKQRQELKEQESNSVLRGLRRVRKCMASNLAVSAFVIICVLIFFIVLIDLCVSQGY